jgi:hypothetical protein
MWFEISMIVLSIVFLIGIGIPGFFAFKTLLKDDPGENDPADPSRND